MDVQQLYTKCLAHGAYFITSNGEAAVIDPLRETAPYIQMAEEASVKIKYIFETHFHADFVSGHLDLAQKTGATIVYGPTAQPNFEAHVAHDNEIFSLGDLNIQVLHTPGHTMESSTFLMKDAHGKDVAIFTGDTLFLGDVGRPDLAQKAANMTREELAGMLFDSLRNKIMVLADDVTVYPGHGEGSACGKAMSSETVDTLGNQKATNYALRANMSREEFVHEVTDGLMPPPQYFPSNAVMNKQGYESFDKVLTRGMEAHGASKFAALMQDLDAMVLDTRKSELFAKGFVPGSVSIGLDGDFAPWVGILVTDIRYPILLITEEGREEEAVTRLARIGYDNVRGFLKGGVEAWKAANYNVDQIDTISAEAFVASHKNHAVVDVRRMAEFEAGHVEDAVNLPLDFIYSNLEKYPNKPFYIHCKGGYRSIAAASILKTKGHNHIVNINGGFDAMVAAGLPVATLN
jgi:glyoxylase-like metal-dependent hydrolase (beta-lactamase superfamily II)/rhodanese-related sulfurtransferase